VVPALSKGLSKLRGLAGAPTGDGILEITSARAPKTSFNGRISPHRRFAFGSLSLNTVKAIKNELGITVNDVVVTLCASAVRAWLLERDELPHDPLIAMIPVSVRAPHETGTFGNKISAMIVPIPTNVAHPRDRLRRAHELLRSAKANHAALPASLLTDATAFIPPAVAALAARTTIDLLSRTRPPLNLVISNVPGPRASLYCAGAELESLFPVSVVVDGVGLNITVMSYRDRLDFGVVTDQGQIPDAWPFIGHLETALDELQSVLNRTGRTIRPAAQAPAPPRPRSGRAARA
jgi:WS/DGAT/MGAT family acyltransferase